jgi:hypothetical protein
MAGFARTARSPRLQAGPATAAAPKAWTALARDGRI